MEKAGIKNQIEGVRSFSFIGDPGCDGLGTEIMSIFHLALHKAAGDIALVGGDIVPNGSRHFYEDVVGMAGGAAEKPVYMLCGNHDTDDYANYFGEKNYYICSESLLLIVLDNSKRCFSEDTLHVLERALKENICDTVVIAFHIPPPNRVTANAVSREEWDKVVQVISPYREKVRYLVCGHVHSYFEDTVDGIPLIASGGGGARIEEVQGVETPYNHWVEFFFDSGGILRHERKDVSLHDMPRTMAADVKKALGEAFANECGAHVVYRLYAQEAVKQGKKGIAKLLYAASDSEFYHARSHYYSMGAVKDTAGSVEQSIEKENFEVTEFYRNCIELAKKSGDSLAEYAFRDAMAAEQVHKKLLETALETLKTRDDIDEQRYYTCTSCGYTMSGNDKPKICPICGAPHDKIKEVEY